MVLFTPSFSDGPLTINRPKLRGLLQVHTVVLMKKMSVVLARQQYRLLRKKVRARKPAGKPL